MIELTQAQHNERNKLKQKYSIVLTELKTIKKKRLHKMTLYQVILFLTASITSILLFYRFYLMKLDKILLWNKGYIFLYVFLTLVKNFLSVLQLSQ